MSWQMRSEALWGTEKMALLHQAHVAVFGLGGVGSWAAEALVRSGLGQLTLIDGDRIAETNLNRQLPALQSNLGQYKSDLLAQRFLDINPQLQVHSHRSFYQPGQGDLYLQGLDLVLDCIDDLPAKVDLIAACAARQLPLLTAGGCAFRLATQDLVLADIFDTAGDPLLKRLRKMLRDRGVQSAQVVYHTGPLLPKPLPAVDPASPACKSSSVSPACEPSSVSLSDGPSSVSPAGRSPATATSPGQANPEPSSVPTPPPASSNGPPSAIFAPASCGLEMARLALLHLTGDQTLPPPTLASPKNPTL